MHLRSAGEATATVRLERSHGPTRSSWSPSRAPPTTSLPPPSTVTPSGSASTASSAPTTSCRPASGSPGLPTPGSPWPAWPARRPHPARHHAHLRHLPPPGPLAIARGRGRRHERRPGRARPRAPAGSSRAPGLRRPLPPPAERFDRLEEQLAIITGLWHTPWGATYDFAGPPLPGCTTARPCPSRSSLPIPPLIVGAAARARTPRPGRPASPTSSTSPSRSPEETAQVYGHVRRGLRGDRPGTRARWRCRPAPSPSTVARRSRRWPAAPARIGRALDELRERAGCAGTPARGGREARRPTRDAAASRASTSRSSTSPTSTTCALIAAEVLPHAAGLA